MSASQQPLLASQEVKYKDYGFINKVIMNVCLAGAYSGYCLGYFNSLNFDDSIRIFSITADRALMQGSLSFCIPVGAGFGGFYARQLTDRFSRRYAFQVVSLVSILATLLLQSKIVPLIFVCRVVQGVTVGVSTVLRSTYIKQFAPLQLAGKFGALNQVFFAIGLISTFAITYFMSLFLQAQSYWRIIYIFPVIFQAWQSYNFAYFFPFQTPKYLLQKGREEDARALVNMIYKAEYSEQRIRQLEKHINISSEKKDQQLVYFPISKANVQPQQKKLTSNKIAVRMAYFIGSIQQFAGIQVIIVYAGEIMLTIEPGFQKIVPLFLQIQGFVASLYSMKLISAHGRKELYQLGLIAMGVFHFITSFCFLIEHMNGDEHPSASFFQNILIVLCLFINRAIFSMTLGPTAWVYLPEIVEPQVTGVATMLNWLSAALVTFIYPITIQLTGSPSFIFFLFGLFVIGGYFVNKKWMVQTKNKPEWQVRKQFDDMLISK